MARQAPQAGPFQCGVPIKNTEKTTAGLDWTLDPIGVRVRSIPAQKPQLDRTGKGTFSLFPEWTLQNVPFLEWTAKSPFRSRVRT